MSLCLQRESAAKKIPHCNTVQTMWDFTHQCIREVQTNQGVL